MRMRQRNRDIGPDARREMEISGRTRYEKHFFSQDAGTPTIAGGLLYWPYEDGRFSAGRGEYMVTNGRDWQWRTFPQGARSTSM